MKSTYKLFGIFWDHKASVDFKDIEAINGNLGLDYKQPFCLFDFIGEYRTVNISELICIENSMEFDSLCNKLRSFHRIAINVDYITCSSSITSSRFYKKRICQIFYAIQQALPDSYIVIQIPYDKLPDWRTLQDLAS
ncbi:MAG: hypothetical protein IKS98_07415 [Lachnospiraceae bacterium]|nr:hypothetical protein [Lachnospiraceae bacterium]